MFNQIEKRVFQKFEEHPRSVTKVPETYIN